jgi:hypothetical protein
MKREKSVSSIRIGCLQQISAWIFMPLEVELSISKDGKTYKQLSIIKNRVPEKKPNCFRNDFLWQGDPVRARYIRIVAKNRGVCPDWHNGAGGRAWIFADEIVVN